MRKQLKTVRGIREFSKEEVLVQFEDMAHQFANKCVKELESFSNNYNDVDDYFQIANIEISKCFENYNLELGSCFSTYLTKCFNNRLIHIKRDLLAQKRRNKKFIYLDQKTENGEIKDIIEDKSSKLDIENIDEESLEEFLSKHLTKEEIKMFIINIKKKMKNDVENLDYLLRIVGNVPNRKMDLAHELNISRPTLDNRIAITMEKIKILSEEYATSRYR